MGCEFSPKELDQIREIAIKMYAVENPGSTLRDEFRFRVIAEATYRFLKEKDLIKNENTVR